MESMDGHTELLESLEHAALVRLVFYFLMSIADLYLKPVLKHN